MTLPRDKAVPREEHLDGYGKCCTCANENKSAPTPKAEAVQQKTTGVVQKKATRIARWDEVERHEAQRNGFPVWVASEQHSERGKGK